ncbi:MAG: hypothetical protein A3E37_02970 [Candidatus Andersenbacteria bacterium RIFCSPHIGHO2_12_FULL_46_9]|nr:MAG: hypothetical protein UW94_C0018G0017 [Parcubacteria group bacterium GW2011_GWA2_45_14]OGY35542.1 MAG: hypothetical protein A3E37_02970 [Candidatus Andersenbacteria bacterium RIFCSPHIGHO2_12_FULL_46_9]OGY35828.1 MAG: hypothetical protein A3B76_05095 [Candidatus Andersenbacteria bacterium RIFCSPHIGHO2_02_FULL_46_16]OGY38579.1 MAG: hypothetical protein A3G57_04755 [Candidatus Andersenbacteria bacterium RIFCSPLOWO2_12_FULL_45_8]HBE90651.1 hypothetical protein [Candidatus Andersenbacteria ba
MTLLKQDNVCPLSVEVDIAPAFGFGLITDKKGQRPGVPYLLLAAENQTGFVVGQHLAYYEEMYHHLSDIMERILLESPMHLPHQFLIKQEITRRNLQPLARSLNIKIKKTSRLTAIAEARRALSRFTSRTVS